MGPPFVGDPALSDGGQDGVHVDRSQPGLEGLHGTQAHARSSGGEAFKIAVFVSAQAVPVRRGTDALISLRKADAS
jgi:hypothetical protein